MMVIYIMEHKAVIKKNSRLKNSDGVFVKTSAKKIVRPYLQNSICTVLLSLLRGLLCGLRKMIGGSLRGGGLGWQEIHPSERSSHGAPFILMAYVFFLAMCYIYKIFKNLAKRFEGGDG